MTLFLLKCPWSASTCRAYYGCAWFTVVYCEVCLSYVTLVHPTQAVETFGNISTAVGTLAILDIHEKFHGDRPRGTPPSAELNARGVAKYSDFGSFASYIGNGAR